MNQSEDLFKNDKEYLLQTYNRIPINISHGDGVYLYSVEGKKYLDFFSGLAVNALGYGNERVLKAIEDQIKKYIHLSNYYYNPPQIKLAEKLLKYSGLSKVFFTNSGTEVIEASLKLIRKIIGPEKSIVSFSNAFHGRSYGALSISGKEKYKKYFSPLLPNITQLEFNNVEQLGKHIDKNTGAIYLEFVQGEGGVQIASKQFVSKLKSLKSMCGFILVADEVQTGIGRTGKPFAYNHYDIDPDIVILAKAIGGGLPLGALLVNEKYSNVFEVGDHGSTFGGNPVACAAGIEIVTQVFENGLINKIEYLGEFFKEKLFQLQQYYSNIIREVRGLGFILGVELGESCSKIVEQFRDNGILVNCTSEKVIRILPPLISEKENIDQFLKVFESLLIKSK